MTILPILLLAIGALAQDSIPHPQLEAADPAVRRQFEDARRRVDILVATDPTGSDTLQALRLLGEMYLAYAYLEAAAATLLTLEPTRYADARSLYLLGHIYENLGRNEEALSVLEQFVGIEPNYAPALLALGRLYLLRPDDLTTADEVFKQALEVDTACAAARYGRGEVFRLRDDWAAAAEQYSLALVAAPEADQIRYALGMALRQLGQIEEARTQLEKIDLQRAAASATSWEGCEDPVLGEISRMATGVSAHLLRGALAYFDGDLDLEVEEYETAVKQDPEDEEARRRYASALFRHERTDDAIAHYREAMRLDDSDATAPFDLAEILRSQGDLQEAEGLYEIAIDRNPRLKGALVQLGALAASRGDERTAESHFRRALEIDPIDGRLRGQLAVLLFRSDRRQEGLVELARALDEAPPTDSREYLELASLLLLMGDVEGGVRHLGAVLETDADSQTRARALTWIGTVQLGSGEFEEAVTTLENAVALEPAFEEARARLEDARQKRSSQEK